jgi:hypothetical protein
VTRIKKAERLSSVNVRVPQSPPAVNSRGTEERLPSTARAGSVVSAMIQSVTQRVNRYRIPGGTRRIRKTAKTGKTSRVFSIEQYKITAFERKFGNSFREIINRGC